MLWDVIHNWSPTGDSIKQSTENEIILQMKKRKTKMERRVKQRMFKSKTEKAEKLNQKQKKQKTN